MQNNSTTSQGKSKLTITPKHLSIPKFMRDYPEIARILLERMKMSSERCTPTITLFFDGSRLKALLNDRGWRRSVFVTCDDPLDAFCKLNRALMVENPDWRKGRPIGE